MIGLWVVVIWKHGNKSKNLATDYTALLIALKKFIANGPHHLSPICTPSGTPLLNSILIQTYNFSTSQLLYIEMSLNISWCYIKYMYHKKQNYLCIMITTVKCPKRQAKTDMHNKNILLKQIKSRHLCLISEEIKSTDSGNV